MQISLFSLAGFTFMRVSVHLLSRPFTDPQGELWPGALASRTGFMERTLHYKSYLIVLVQVGGGRVRILGLIDGEITIVYIIG